MRVQPVFLCTLLAAPAAAQVTELASLGPAGALGDGNSVRLALSPDARFVAFSSAATNLVSGDTNGKRDVFLRDRLAGTTVRVSVSSASAEGDLDSDVPALTPDGRYVAFASGATNLVPGDTNNFGDVFVRDVQLGTTVRVSVSSAGLQADSHAYAPSISADGRYVVFLSGATNLVPGDTLGWPDVFLHDLVTGTTERVNVSSAGAEANQSAISAAISADGGCVVFDSSATNLVGGDSNGFADVFVRELASGTTLRVSLAGAATQSNHVSEAPSISADGRYVAFESYASNFDPGDTNGLADIYVRDRVALTTTRASLSSAGAQPDMGCWVPRISPDGRSVAFSSNSATLVAQDTNGTSDVFVRDLELGLTQRVSVATNGAQADGPSSECALSADGRFAAFMSAATNLVPGDTNNRVDAFLRDRRANGATSLCDPGSAGVIACPCANPPAGVGRGCDNSSASGGARLMAAGIAYLAQDSLLFTTGGENPVALSILVQGDTLAPAGLVFGQGVRCVAGVLKRLYAKSAQGGSIQAPDPSGGDPSVSARSSALGDPIQPGESRWYFVYYGDPSVLGGCPAASTFNTTPSVRIDWQP